MNDKFTNNSDEESIARKLNQIAEQTHANGQFAAELEERLRDAHPPRAGWFASFAQISPTLRWVALMIVLAVVLSWSIKALIPAPQPGFNSTPGTFVCPVTLPNGSQPYGKTGEEDPNFHGNNQLWTKLWPNGKIYMSPTDQLPDGSFSQKWYFERGTQGTLTVEGHRLDAKAEPLKTDITDGYGETGLQVLGLIFPTTGCWEVTGRVGDASLTFVTEVVFGEAITTPAVTINQNATPVSEQTGYDFRGAKLYLGVPLPESPAAAHVYSFNKQDQQATLAQARALADRFGIQGEVYSEPTYIFDTNNYMFSDGKQSLSVYSERFFSYVADLSKTSYFSKNTPNDNAEGIIREFLQARGFDFPFRVIPSDFFDGYIVQPLAPDSIPMQYESFTPPSMIVMLDETGAVLRVDAYLMDYDPAPVGEYGIISAQEALEKLLDDSLPGGKTEFVHSAGKMPHEWVHSYPDNQPITAYGHITIYPAADSGKPPLVLMDGVPVTGNMQGLESLDHYTLVRVTGQYVIENGIRKLNVESWDSHVTETSVTGTLSHQAAGILLTSDDGSGQQYPLIDPPADVPLDTKVPETQLAVYGVIADGKMYWTYIQFFEDNSGGGGGGGGGLGFYKLNLNGPPVPFPTATPQPNASTQNVEYVVQKGDTALSIASSFGISVEQLHQANNLDSANTISLGQTLVIPVSTTLTSQPTSYVVQENDTLASIALNFGISVDALMQANGITKNQVITGQTLIIPSQQPPTDNLPVGVYVVREGDTLSAIAQNYKTTVDELVRLNNLSDTAIYVGQPLSVPIPEDMKQKVEDMRGYLTVTIHNRVGGISAKEYTLEVAQDTGGGVTLYNLEGSMLGELDPYNGLPILVSGTLDPTGKLVVESYKIPYPDLHFQILKGTQKAQQLGGQDVIVFTTEDGNSYVEFLATNNQPTGTFTDHIGERIQQEVLIIPDETFAGLPVTHIYQSAIIQENGTELQVQGNQIRVYNDGSDSGSEVYTQPNLTINKIELVYFVSNPYYQVKDPNYDQRSPYLQPVWHFHGRFDDGTEFDMLIQALKQEFLLPELVPGAGMG